ncbi:MAG: DUF3821 domain-containing protein, partial [Methanophagales archaeon]|nr:DUF3821 domain-containing protein [Methanophagales archaeon]
METKGKSKAIIGIALAAIMIASVFAAMMPTSARTAIGDIERGDTVFIGEKHLYMPDFANDTVFYGMKDTSADGETIELPDNTDFNVLSTYVAGLYNTSGRDTTVTDLNIKEPTIGIDVLVDSSSIVDGSLPQGGTFKVRASPNFGGVMKDATAGGDVNVTIKFTKPNGITVSYPITATSQEFDTDFPTDDTWSTGTWKVKIETDKDTCNELDISSSQVEFDIRSEELTIEAEKDEVGRGDDMVLKVKGNPKANYYLAIEDVKAGEEPEIKDSDDVVKRGTGEGNAGNNTAAWIKTGSDGIADIGIGTTGADKRTYTIHVYDTYDVVGAVPSATTDPFEAPDDVTGEKDKDDVDVEVVGVTVTFDIPTKVIIGETLTIKGTVSTGKKVDILIEDEYEDSVDKDGDNILVDENKEFEVDWETDKYMTGSYTIKAYVDYKGDEDVDPDEDDDDGAITVRLIEQGLSAEQPRNVVAEKDDYTIEGTATGVDDVDYVLIGPKGTRSKDVKYVKEGLLIDSTRVKDNEFSEDETMKDGLDTGLWIAVVLIPGRDGTYGDLGDVGAGKLKDADLDFEGKDQSQIVAILSDHTIDVAGSDDKLILLSFKVESGYVDLNPVESVGVGDPLNISGVTNREPETTITISTFSKPAGALDLPAAMADVEWTTADEGTFTATIDTSDAVEGTYVLEADDGDGNTDTITVVIGEAAPEPTATAVPTAEPTATAVPTPAATAEPTAEPTPTEEPGFEAVF